MAGIEGGDMSIIKELFPLCDICGDTCPDLRGYGTVAILRDNMRKGGWTRKNGKDVCFDCGKAMTKTLDHP
jgi:hypothetical protein